MSWALRAVFATSTVVALNAPHLEPGDLALPAAPPEKSVVADDSVVLTLRAPASTMILVAGGSFVMGSTGDDVVAAVLDCQSEPGGDRCETTLFANETPLHKVTLSAYWLDRTEVTVGDYARCAATGRCRPLPLGEGARRFDKPEYPASLVTWDEARIYCEYRGARLPTEAEFERASRGAVGRRYPWGNLYNAHASNHGRIAWQMTDATDGYAELAPVGSFPAGRTPDGFLDLAGNVSEWVADRYAPEYEDAEAVDPMGPAVTASTPARVVRGGDYRSAAPWLRGAAREFQEPSTRRPWLGFRCARTAKTAPRDSDGAP
jgi:formylglycine-generating enzyme required for sulfatase activity